MKINVAIAAFIAAVFIASPLQALAEPGRPIQGTDVGLDHDPGNLVVATTQTNSAGVAVFQNVKPGQYHLTYTIKSAVVEISIPGQAKIAIPRERTPFTVTGKQSTTVTVTITKTGPGQLQLSPY